MTIFWKSWKIVTFHWLLSSLGSVSVCRVIIMVPHYHAKKRLQVCIHICMYTYIIYVHVSHICMSYICIHTIYIKVLKYHRKHQIQNNRCVQVNMDRNSNLHWGEKHISSIAFFIYFSFLFIYFWLHWVFIAACRLSLVAASGVSSSLLCEGFSLRWLLLLWSTGSRAQAQ